MQHVKKLNVAILDDYQDVALSYADWSILHDRCNITVFNVAIPTEQAVETLMPFDIICHLRERMPFPRLLIDALPNLKLIVTTGNRHRLLDIDAATENGIAVCNTAGRPHLDSAATELAWALTLAVARNIVSEAEAVRQGEWQTTVGMLLAGKTLGLLGLGRLGQKMAAYGQVFDMNVVSWSPNLTLDRARQSGVELVTKEELFRRSDVLSIHLVLGDRSRELVGASEIALMKRGAILVNTSRGPIVQEDSLVAALESGAIRAGIDVFDQEPLPPDHPIQTAPNCVLTPHLGYVTEDTYRAFFEDMVENIQGFLNGNPVRMLNSAGLNAI